MEDNPVFSTFDIVEVEHRNQEKGTNPSPALVEALEAKGFTLVHAYSFNALPMTFETYSALLSAVANETQLTFKCYSSVPVGENPTGKTAVEFAKNETFFRPDEDDKEVLRSN